MKSDLVIFENFQGSLPLDVCLVFAGDSDLCMRDERVCVYCVRTC